MVMTKRCLTLNKPKMTVIAGTNGAGKSTFINKPILRGGGYIIDPDAIAKTLIPKTPEKARLQAGRISIQLIDQMIRECESFVMETTLSGRLPFIQMKQAKENGFEIVIHFIGLDHLKRHIQRVRERVQMGGHDIPVEDIIRRYDRSQQNLREAAKLADQVMLWDNTYAARDLVEIRDQELIFVAEELPGWAKAFIAYWKENA